MKAQRVKVVGGFPEGAVLLPPHKPVRLFAAVIPGRKVGTWRVGRVVDGEALARVFLECYDRHRQAGERRGFICPVAWSVCEPVSTSASAQK
jgi:hypothetical protein